MCLQSWESWLDHLRAEYNEARQYAHNPRAGLANSLLPRRAKENNMNITMDKDVAAKLQALLAAEGDDAVVRVREAKVGAG